MIPGYRILQEIHRGRKRIVYRGQRVAEGTPVIIKTLLPEFHAAGDIAALQREFELMKSMRCAGVARAYAFEQSLQNPALILEDIAGEPLRHFIDSGAIDLDTFFEISTQLAATLGTVHQHGLIHKDLAPKNIIFNVQTKQVQLIDFSISSWLPQESQKFSHPNVLEGTLAYMSPEQTGRMNRALDYRTDFYSLGVTFYEMLTGQLPFRATDPLALVHAHIAQMPPLPQELNAVVPQALGAIVMKLLAKTAESRYQSAKGLQADLEICRAQWQAGAIGEGFVPGQQDFSDRFQIPQKLYGREQEIAALMAAFEQVSQGAAVIMLVSGYAGIGKSALINEVHKPIARQGGYFISGKFDQFKRDIPYSAIVQAFKELFRQLLTESEAQIAAWKHKLAQALGANGQVLVEVIPELELIIGTQPPAPELPPAESQNRFNLLFQRCVQAFTERDHPLVLFLDDLQWADSASLKLLQALATNSNIQSLLLLGAYRDNEVNAAHPLFLMKVEIEKGGTRLHEIALTPLSSVDLNQFVAEAMHCETKEAQPLSELLQQKTQGNPFFVAQFLKTLHQEKLLVFDYEGRRWGCNLARLRSLDITDNVVELMASKIQKLPAATQRVTELAACIGNQFDLTTLAVVHDKPLSQTAQALREALHEGLILPISDAGQAASDLAALRNDMSATEDLGTPATGPENPGRDSATAVATVQSTHYKFLHDRVQQAAYALIPAEHRHAVHLQVGRLMLRHSQAGTLEEKLFDIANHLNMGSALMTAQEEKTNLAKLNLQAGLKAKASAAYKPASSYLRAGLALLGEPGWEAQYELTFALYRELAECEYLCGEFQQAERSFELLLGRARTTLERAEIHNLRIIQYENMAQYDRAVQAGRQGLQLFGMALPEDLEEKKAAFAAELQAINQKLGGRRIEELIHLPVMSEPAMKMSMKLLMTVWAPAYIAGDNNLTVLIPAMMVRLSLEYGNTEASCYGYVTHAITVGTGLGDYQTGYEYGRLALAINDKFHDVKLRAKAHHMFSCFVNFWRQPLKTCFPHSQDAYRSGLETGDFVYATYAVIHESWHALYCGYELNQYQKNYAPNVSFLMQIKNHSFADAQRLILHWALALQGLTEHKLSFSDAGFDEHTYLQNYSGAPFFETFYYVAKLHLHYSFESYLEAHAMALRAENVVHALVGTLWMATLCFYHALTLAALYNGAATELQHEHARQLEAMRTQMQRWAENSPENFLHAYLLISAEMARISGKPAEAIANYERAMQSARENGMLQHEALAQELYAKFWLQRQNAKIAGLYLAEAHYGYQRWGAHAKAQDLAQRYSQFFSSAGMTSATPPDDRQTSQLTIQDQLASLDLQTVIKASQALSGEITLHRLLEKLMRIVMENAGAQKALLLLEQEGELTVAAEGAVTKNQNVPIYAAPPVDPAAPRLRHAQPVSASSQLALALVNYVRRTGEHLVVAEAARDSRFANDPYIAQNQPLSIFCLPILHQGKLAGVLYLENNLTANAFTPARVEVMQMLAAQAAIALENSRLYEDMKQEVTERKRAEETLRAALAEVEQLKNRLQAENVYLQEEIRTQQNYEEIAGSSAAIQKVFRNIEKVARTDATVLITGETGTGKELVARAIHSSSNRRESALITVNCGALPSGLIESELFGHEKGAFTGATTRKKGRFELADGGTIFLDEIGELALETQTKLLRVLQEQEFERVGGAQTLKVNVRVIAATNRNLEEAVRRGTFRADLYYRLNIFPIHLPALRERREDIVVLTHHFTAKFSRRLGKRVDRIAAAALEKLTHYEWPGNVRELANVLERAVILCDGGVLQQEHLGIAVHTPQPENQPVTMEEAERLHILKALEETQGVIGGSNGAAARLGLNRTTLLARMKKLGIEKRT